MRPGSFLELKVRFAAGAGVRVSHLDGVHIQQRCFANHNWAKLEVSDYFGEGFEFRSETFFAEDVMSALAVLRELYLAEVAVHVSHGFGPQPHLSLFHHSSKIISCAKSPAASCVQVPPVDDELDSFNSLAENEDLFETANLNMFAHRFRTKLDAVNPQPAEGVNDVFQSLSAILEGFDSADNPIIAHVENDDVSAHPTRRRRAGD